jgi:single-stranded DNA-specific DHH superfamily exonuclease
MPAFVEAFEQAVRAQMGQKPRPRTLQVDVSMSIEQAMAAIDELRTLQPFGKDFPEPLIHCPGLRVHDASVLGADRTHLKVRVQSQGSLRNTELLLWRQADRIGEFRRSRMLEVVGSPKPSTNPRWDPSFEVKDLLFVD